MSFPGFPSRMTLYGRNIASVTITSAAGDLALGSVFLISGLNYGALKAAFLKFTFRKCVDTSAALNFVVSNQYIQMYDGSTWQNAIYLPVNSLSTPATTTNFGGRILGEYNLATYIKALIATGGTGVLLQWSQADAQGNNLVVYDLEFELELIFAADIPND